jgi:ubiquinone/menaquinone biosynthesis C-methylase UbiE
MGTRDGGAIHAADDGTVTSICNSTSRIRYRIVEAATKARTTSADSATLPAQGMSRILPGETRHTVPMYQSLDEVGVPVAAHVTTAEDSNVPEYLQRHYWWAYVHPKAVQFFDRLWLINLILFGNYHRLRDAALADLDDAPFGKVLQVACAYGNLSVKLAKRAAFRGGELDVVDVLPIQLKNLKWKLPARAPVRLLRMDSTHLNLPDSHYDCVLLYLLLHEQPEAERTRTLKEACRVLKPGGKLLIVEYDLPSRWNPLRYILYPFLYVLEPFVPSLWRRSVASLLPPGMTFEHQRYFGGLYQKIIATRVD